jgi:IclR family acetate operon transcriptional repressor
MGPATNRSARPKTRVSERRVPVVRSVARAFRIADALWHAPDGMRLTDISRQVGLHKTTVLRLLATMHAIGVARKDEPSDRYICSPAAFLTAGCGERETLRQADTVRAVLEQLTEATGLMAGLATPIPERRRTAFVAWLVPGSQVERDTQGARFGPMHASASGKVYLASLPQDELRQWMRGDLPALTDRTITSPRRLLRELAQVRRDGYAVSREEWLPGIFILAVPVRGAHGRTVASLAVATQSEQILNSKSKRWVSLLIRASERLSALLTVARLAEGRIRPGESAGGTKRTAQSPAFAGAMVQSVERAARIMGALYHTPDGKRLADISEEAGLPKTTILRLLNTLVSLRLADKHEDTGLYHRNASVWLNMACEIAGPESSVSTIQTVMGGLEEETGMLAGLATPELQRRGMVFLEWYLRPNALSLRPRARNPLPVHATAVGQAYLANLSPEDMREWVPAKLERYTEHTISSPKRLAAELALVRERGYALCRGTYAPGRFALAVPVLRQGGGAVAAISIGGPDEMLNDAGIRQWVAAMRRASDRLSSVLLARTP